MTRPDLPGDLLQRLDHAHRELQARDEALVSQVQALLAGQPTTTRQAVLATLRWEQTMQRGLALVPVVRAAGYWPSHAMRYVAQYLGIGRNAFYRRRPR